MQENFLPNDNELPFAEVSTQGSSNPGFGQEYVKVMAVGSRKGIDIIIKRLHAWGLQRCASGVLQCCTKIQEK